MLNFCCWSCWDSVVSVRSGYIHDCITRKRLDMFKCRLLSMPYVLLHFMTGMEFPLEVEFWSILCSVLLTRSVWLIWERVLRDFHDISFPFLHFVSPYHFGLFLCIVCHPVQKMLKTPVFMNHCHFHFTLIAVLSCFQSLLVSISVPLLYIWWMMLLY